MSVKLMKMNKEFQGSLRSSKKSLNIVEDNESKKFMIERKNPLEIPERFRLGINPNNPNYLKQDFIKHNSHRRDGIERCKSTENVKSYYKRGAESGAQKSNINFRMVGVRYLIKQILIDRRT